MSTRCQVTVIQEGLGWKEELTLYHHTDGYPEYMLPVIKEARDFKRNDFNNDWEKGRAGKVASYLCAVDPGTFEPEDNHKLHGDIEYYYILYCINTLGGSIAERVKWEIQIFKPLNFKTFWDKPSKDNLKSICTRMPLEKAIDLMCEKVKP